MDLIKRVICLSMLAVYPGVSQNTPATEPYLRQAAITQAAGMIHIHANNPRPLEQTLDALQQKYGWLVDYEDPRYISHLDFVDSPPGSERPQVPAGKSFDIEFPATSPDEEKIFRLVLDTYNHSQNPGQFELRRNSQGDFYVVGTAAHDEKGANVQQQAVLDLPVTLASKERTIIETVNLICQAIAKQSHTAVAVGIHPRNTLDHTMVKVGGAKVPARELLLQCLQASSHKLYWRLLFDPSTKEYILNIHSLRPA